jgi:hypothetical protein
MGKLSFCKLNLVDLFIKLLPLAIFNKCVKDIGMKRLKDLQDLGGTPIKVSWLSHHIILFSFMSFTKISY